MEGNSYDVFLRIAVSFFPFFSDTMFIALENYFSVEYTVSYAWTRFTLGLLILERVHSQHKLNFVKAIIQCSSCPSRLLHKNLPLSSGIQEAISIIEREAYLQELKNLLVGHLKTFYRCQSCCNIPESLASSAQRIHIFKANDTNTCIAYPVIVSGERRNNIEKHCDNCQFNSKDIEMEVAKQIFIQLPQCLIVSVNFLHHFQYNCSHHTSFSFLLSIDSIILTLSFF